MALEQKTIQGNNINDFLDQFQKAVETGYSLVGGQDFSMGMATGYFVGVVEKDTLPKKVYTKKQLDDLGWEDLKIVGRLYGHGGRDRSVLVTKVLASQESI
jgi:hypothetical protein